MIPWLGMIVYTGLVAEWVLPVRLPMHAGVGGLQLQKRVCSNQARALHYPGDLFLYSVQFCSR
jgi:hypothetical protein